MLKGIDYEKHISESSLSQFRKILPNVVFFTYQVGDQYRSNDDGEPSGTAGKPMYSAIVSSGIDRVMVVVIRCIFSESTYE